MMVTGVMVTVADIRAADCTSQARWKRETKGREQGEEEGEKTAGKSWRGTKRKEPHSANLDLQP